MRVARRYVVTGRVQGVGFRAFVHRAARVEGLHGWVRNRRDGSVEALVAGPAAAVERFVDWAWIGPAAARVERVSATPAPAPQGARFERLPTL